MQLHRSLGNDWESVASAERNQWQQWAAQSGGYVSPGNIITIIGGLLVLAGLYMILVKADIWIALGLIASGRFADLLDGIVAERTGTKSPLGEAIDATTDKIVMVLTIPVLWSADIISGWVFAALTIHTVWIVGLYFMAKHTGKRLHPSRSGKLAAAAEWLMIVSYVLAFAFSAHGPRSWLLDLARCVFVIFAVCAIYSALSYAHNLRTDHD